jgi:hypothetical protein
VIENGLIVVDPTEKELKIATNLFCMGYMIHSKSIPYVFSKGKTTNELLEKVKMSIKNLS